jgi:type IV secretion system protein VirB9
MQSQVPNIPPELAEPPPVILPPRAPPPGDSSADLAQPGDAASPDEQPEVPTQSAEKCDTADCLPGNNSTPTPHTTPHKSAPSVHIGKPAQAALVESHAWAENPGAMPLRDSGGRVVFVFSESAPTIVCAPLRICDIELEPGEVVQNEPHIGDAVRWRIAPAVSGSGDRKVIHLIVKPTEVGLDTNVIIPTDRRTYHLRLVSSAEHYVSSVGFDYPEDQQKAWQSLVRTSSRSDSSVTTGEMPTVAVNRLNFNYRIKVVSGKPSFRPLRAMDDGYHTYIAMNEDMPEGEAPVLIGIAATGEEQMINYRLKGNLYVVDGTLFKLALVSGVGKKQQRIELTRDPCKSRGWLGICWDPKE